MNSYQCNNCRKVLNTHALAGDRVACPLCGQTQTLEEALPPQPLTVLPDADEGLEAERHAELMQFLRVWRHWTRTWLFLITLFTLSSCIILL